MIQLPGGFWFDPILVLVMWIIYAMILLPPYAFYRLIKKGMK